MRAQLRTLGGQSVAVVEGPVVVRRVIVIARLGVPNSRGPGSVRVRPPPADHRQPAAASEKPAHILPPPP